MKSVIPQAYIATLPPNERCSRQALFGCGFAAMVIVCLQLNYGVRRTHTHLVQIQLPLLAGQIAIRPWNETDVQDYFTLRHDPGIRRYVGSPPEFVDQALNWLRTDIKRTQSGESVRLAIEIRGGTPIGLIALEDFNRGGEPGLELVVGVAQTNRRIGVAENAARALIGAAFSADPSLTAIYGRRAWGNAPSRALIRCLGLRSAGLTEASDPQAICPDRLYVLNRDSWRDA